MLKVLNFKSDVFAQNNACSFKMVGKLELFRSIFFDGVTVSQLFSRRFFYDSHCFDSLWRSQ